MGIKAKIVAALLFLLAIVGLYSFSLAEKSNTNYVPKDGFIPNAQTAIKIAEAIWIPIYGESVLEKKPYNAILKNDSIWIVEGTLPKGMKGGTPYAEINKYDGKILNVTHGK